MPEVNKDQEISNALVGAMFNNVINLETKNVDYKSLSTCTTTTYSPNKGGNSKFNLNDLGRQIYQINVDNGFYEKEEGFPARIALMHSELSEALEADRKNLMDDKLPHRTGIEVELADALIRILDCAAHMNLDIDGAVYEKMEVNKKRGYKHGGKKY